MKCLIQALTFTMVMFALCNYCLAETGITIQDMNLDMGFKNACLHIAKLSAKKVKDIHSNEEGLLPGDSNIEKCGDISSSPVGLEVQAKEGTDEITRILITKEQLGAANMDAETLSEAIREKYKLPYFEKKRAKFMKTYITYYQYKGDGYEIQVNSPLVVIDRTVSKSALKF